MSNKEKELWWDAYGHIAAFALPIMNDFCEKRSGSVPAIFLIEHNDDFELANQEWSAILEKIRSALQSVVDETDVDPAQNTERQEGLELFGKWFTHLWD